MPTVPGMKQQQRLRVGSPSILASSSQARLTGESIEEAGRSLASLGASYAKFQKASEANERRLAVDGARSEAKKFIQDFRNNKEYIESDGKEDLKSFDTSSKSFLQGYKKNVDKKFHRDIENAINGVMISDKDGRGQVILDSRTKTTNMLKRKVVESTGDHLANVSMRPLEWQDELEVANDLLESMSDPENGIINPAELPRMKRENEKAFFDSAVKAMINDEWHAFITAKRMVVTKKGLTKKERDNYLNQITKAKYAYKDRQYTLKERAYQHKERERNKKQEENLADLTVQIESETDPAKLQILETKLKDQAKNLDVTTVGFRQLRAKFDEKDTLASETVTFSSLYSVTEDATPANIDKQMNDIKALVKSERMEPNHGAKVLSVLRALKNKGSQKVMESAPYKTYLKSLQEFTLTDDGIQAIFPKHMKEAKFREKYKIESEYMELTAIKGVDPKTAYQLLLRKYYQGSRDSRVLPGAVLAKTKEDINDALIQLDAKRNLGKITDQELADQIMQIEDAERVIRAGEEINDLAEKLKGNKDLDKVTEELNVLGLPGADRVIVPFAR